MRAHSRKCVKLGAEGGVVGVHGRLRGIVGAIDDEAIEGGSPAPGRLDGGGEARGSQLCGRGGPTSVDAVSEMR